MRRPGLVALLALALLGAIGVAVAHGERRQEGNLIVTLDGGIAPLKLPRDRTAPVEVRLDGGLRTTDGGLLPRVTEIELGLPGQGVLTTHGLATCPLRSLRDTTSKQALATCGDALVGHGGIEADVLLPNQEPFSIHAQLLAFNGRVGGRQAVLMHAVAAEPPTVIVIPFVVSHRKGRFATVLVGALSPSLGPWPHFAHFQMTLGRRYSYRGKSFSYLSASCPIPPRLSAGFFSFAETSFTLADGSRIGTGITRGCRGQ
jgi:hypothetical protein